MYWNVSCHILRYYSIYKGKPFSQACSPELVSSNISTGTVHVSWFDEYKPFLLASVKIGLGQILRYINLKLSNTNKQAKSKYIVFEVLYWVRP
jgi:hypothetical protein